MAEYIKKRDLVEFACRHVDGKLDANDIARFPTADVVPVVRCCQCKKVEWIDNEITKHRQYFCPLYNHELVGASHYCSYGERRCDR